VRAALLLAAGALGVAAPPPPPSPPLRPVFGSQLDLVYVTVTVLDGQGQPVSDLPASAFEVREDGRPRPVEVFWPPTDQRSAVDVALLLDTSGSMSAELERAQRAALAVLQRIPRLRRHTVISFDTDIRFWKADVDPSTLLPEILAARPPNGASVIRSALAAGIDDVSRESGRGAIVLLSDGVDLGSPVTETQLFRTIESANVAVYPIPFVASQFSPGAVNAPLGRGRTMGGSFPIPTAPDTMVSRGFLTRLAALSGGVVLESEGGRLERALDRLVTELGSQYVIGFAPASAAPRSHRLDVRVEGRGLKVRHRDRYHRRLEAARDQ
jgi:VWFA-related protein